MSSRALPSDFVKEFQGISIQYYLDQEARESNENTDIYRGNGRNVPISL